MSWFSPAIFSSQFRECIHGVDVIVYPAELAKRSQPCIVQRLSRSFLIGVLGCLRMIIIGFHVLDESPVSPGRSHHLVQWAQAADFDPREVSPS